MSEFVLPFGKYCGNPIKECPESYLDFLCDYSVAVDDVHEVHYTDSCADRLDELVCDKDSYMSDMSRAYSGPKLCAFPSSDSEEEEEAAASETETDHADCCRDHSKNHRPLSHLNIASESFYDALQAALMVSTHAAAVHVNNHRHEWKKYACVTGYKSPVNAQVFLWAIHHDTVKAARAYVETKRLCRLCFCHMPPIGTARQNGAQHHGDWAQRYLHKRCFRELVNND